MRTVRMSRARSGLSLVELAEASGVDRNAISQIERGRRKPHLETLVKLSRALNTPLEEFIDELEELEKKEDEERHLATA
jgi:transcriptional regulator with XRE-family HTH domain